MHSIKMHFFQTIPTLGFHFFHQYLNLYFLTFFLIILIKQKYIDHLLFTTSLPTTSITHRLQYDFIPFVYRRLYLLLMNPFFSYYLSTLILLDTSLLKMNDETYYHLFLLYSSILNVVSHLTTYFLLY